MKKVTIEYLKDFSMVRKESGILLKTYRRQGHALAEATALATAEVKKVQATQILNINDEDEPITAREIDDAVHDIAHGRRYKYNVETIN